LRNVNDGRGEVLAFSGVDVLICLDEYFNNIAQYVDNSVIVNYIYAGVGESRVI
jgi:hypothetical protein